MMPQDNLPQIPEFERLLELREILGLVSTLTAVPTHIPKKFSEQLYVVVTGGNASLYIYDTNGVSGGKWRAATLGT